MDIQKRDYYKNKKEIIKYKNPKEFLIWTIIIFMILSLILSSLKF